MPEGHFDETPQPTARKNSILVKDENSASKVNMNAAHPHFVEQISPHRSPSGSDAAPPSPSSGANSSSSSISGVTTAQDRLNNFHFGGGAPSGAASAQAQGEAQTSQPHAQPSVPGSAPSSSRNRQYPPPFPGLSSGPTSSAGSENRPSSPALHASDDAASTGNSNGQTPYAGRATSKQPSDPRIPMDDGKIHISIGVTGSSHVSSVKSIILKSQSIYGERVAIQIIVTPAVEKIVASSSKEHAAHPPQQPQQQSQQPNAAGASSPTTYHDAVASPKTTTPPPQGQSQAQGPTTPQSQPQQQPQSQPATFKEKLSHQNIRVWHDSDEWDTWHGRNDPIIHIESRRWADISLIAPSSANTLGKIAMGSCDNSSTNVVRAWNSQYPILIAPAMVTYAYNHPATKRQSQSIREEMKWIEISRPTEKVVGSTGGIGMGGMMPWNEIVDRVVQKSGGYPDEDEDDEDDEDENENATTMDERREQANRSSANGDDDDDDDDDEEDDDDEDDNISKDVEHTRVELSPHGSPI